MTIIKLVKTHVNSTDIRTKFHRCSVAVANLYPQDDFHEPTQYIYSKTLAKDTELKQTVGAYVYDYGCIR